MAAAGVETRRASLVRAASMVTTTEVIGDLEKGLVYNVPHTCPLTKKPFTISSTTGNIMAVYCPAVRAVFDREALTTYLVKIILAQLNNQNPETACLTINRVTSIGKADAEPATEASSESNPYVTALAQASSDAFYRVQLYPLNAAISGDGVAAGCFKLRAPLIFSITRNNTYIEPTPHSITSRPDPLDDHEITALISEYMKPRKDRKNKEEDSALITAIHEQRTAKGLSVDPSGNGPDLSDLNLSRVVLVKLDLEGRRIVNTVFDHCTFKNCNLKNTGFISCDLTKASFDSCDLGGHRASFYKSYVDRASFESSNRCEFHLNIAEPTKTIKTREDYEKMLESLGALDSNTLRADRHTRLAEGQTKFELDMKKNPWKYQKPKEEQERRDKAQRDFLANCHKHFEKSGDAGPGPSSESDHLFKKDDLPARVFSIETKELGHTNPKGSGQKNITSEGDD
jgi:hypothetical protein